MTEIETIFVDVKDTGSITDETRFKVQEYLAHRLCRSQGHEVDCNCHEYDGETRLIDEYSNLKVVRYRFRCYLT